MSSKELVSIYKKNGAFDRRRRNLLSNFKELQTHNNLILKLQKIVDNTVKTDPTLLVGNRGKGAALIQTTLIQQQQADSILGIVDRDIQEKIIDLPEFRNLLRDELEEIDRVKRGITDAEWEKIKLKKLEERKAEEEARRAEEEEKVKEDRRLQQVEPPRPKPKVSRAPKINLHLKY